MFEQIKLVVVKVLNVSGDKITMTTHLQDDLGADSLDAVDLIMALEEEFNLTISDEDSQKLRTIGEIVTYIENELGK